MKTRAILLITLIGVTALAAFAQETDIPNLQVHDGDAWLIESFSTISIYAVNPETDERVDIEFPVVSVTYPDDPIQLVLEPGFYEFVVGMFFLAEEVVYFRFEIVEDEANVVDLRELELPEALATY